MINRCSGWVEGEAEMGNGQWREGNIGLEQFKTE